MSTTIIGPVAGADPRSAVSLLTPASRAQLLFQHARSAANEQLWQAAMGSEMDAREPDNGARPAATPDISGLSELLDQVVPDAFPRAAPAPPFGQDRPDEHREAPSQARVRPVAPQAYGELISSAASRTGIPAEALATLIDAEAAKGPRGEWLPYSRNPHSSAAGLGQFLSGTWLGEAQREGTTLNALARARGWLTDQGRIAEGARSPLLALRYDPKTAIDAIADLAGSNIAAMRKAGLSLGDGARDLAKLVYLTHHLGVADAVRFLTGGIDPQRAARLLSAQVGSAAAGKRISLAGDSVTAHRQWLLGYLANNIRPERFTSNSLG